MKSTVGQIEKIQSVQRKKTMIFQDFGVKILKYIRFSSLNARIYSIYDSIKQNQRIYVSFLKTNKKKLNSPQKYMKSTVGQIAKIQYVQHRKTMIFHDFGVKILNWI